MHIKALTRSIIEWDAERGSSVVINIGETGELSDALAAPHIETGAAEAADPLPQLDHDHDGSAGGSEPHDPPALTGKNKAALLAIAADEGIILPEGATNKEIVGLIEAVRSGEMVAAEGEADDEGGPPA